MHRKINRNHNPLLAPSTQSDFCLGTGEDIYPSQSNIRWMCTLMFAAVFLCIPDPLAISGCRRKDSTPAFSRLELPTGAIDRIVNLAVQPVQENPGAENLCSSTGWGKHTDRFFGMTTTTL